MESVFSFLSLLILIGAVSFGIYKLISKEMDKRGRLEIERISRLVESESGRKTLEAEALESSKKYERLAPFLMVSGILTHVFLVVVCSNGVWMLLQKLAVGTDISVLLQENRGYLLTSPLILVFSVFELWKLARTKTSVPYNSSSLKYVIESCHGTRNIASGD